MRARCPHGHLQFLAHGADLEVNVSGTLFALACFLIFLSLSLDFRAASVSAPLQTLFKNDSMPASLVAFVICHL